MTLKTLVTGLDSDATVAEYAAREAFLEASDFRCGCDGGPGRAPCLAAHAVSPAVRCQGYAVDVQREPDGALVVLCDTCRKARNRAARNLLAVDERRRADALGDQLDLFSQLTEGN